MISFTLPLLLGGDLSSSGGFFSSWGGFRLWGLASIPFMGILRDPTGKGGEEVDD